MKRYKELCRNLHLRLTADDHEQAGGFLHFCDEWDGLLIDQNDPEFAFCGCSFSNHYDPETGKLTALGLASIHGRAA